MTPLILPQISLNGTHPADLIGQQCDVVAALRDLLEAMADAAPNGRDYQFRPSEFSAARDAWNQRMETAKALLDEVQLHTHNIDAIAY